VVLSLGWHEQSGSVPFRGAWVLTVAKVTQGLAAGYAEYLEGKAKPAELGDYYLRDRERVESPGRWVQGAAALAADPEVPVSGDQLRALMAVRRPDTGAPLRRAGAGGETVAALDATFSAPKSVSAMWAIADPQLRGRIEEAHEEAIDRALSYALEHVAMIRQRIDKDTLIHAKPKTLVATSWRHTTARAVDGLPPDPQLHSHVLLHAALRRDGHLVAIDSRSWLTHRREVGAAYRTELARELNHLGFEIQRGTGRGQRYFEIAGVPQALMDQWSSRHRQVQAAIEQRLADQREQLRVLIAAGAEDWERAVERLYLLEQTGRLAPAEERLMAAATRSRKAPVTHEELDRHWAAAASRHGLERAELRRVRSPRPALEPASEAQLLEGLTEFDATFPARDARAVALERSAGVPIADALGHLKALRQAGELLVLADRTGTTREHRGREQTTVQVARRLADSPRAPLPANVISNEIRRLDRQLARRGGKLSEEQRKAIRQACGASALVVIEGQAGTGKSTTLIGIARAHQQTGREIVVTSTAALAAERLARELSDAGVQANAYSTAALNAGIDAGRIAIQATSTVIHDEAALASTREQQHLLAAIETAQARLIEIGDPWQNQPVGAGGLWPSLEQAARDADAHIELARNQRAQDPDDRRDQALFRENKTERAIRGYAARDRVHITTEQTHAENLALDAAHRDRRAGKTTLVIAQTSNEHLDELNARAQAISRQHRELGDQPLPVPGRPYALHAGDDVQIRRTFAHPKHGWLRNGTGAQIIDVNADAGAVALRIADGRTVTLDTDQATRADLRLAYVQHPFPAQGQTTDTAHLIVSEHVTREGSYVALTRARERTELYAATPTQTDAKHDRLAAVAERMSRSEPELPSIHTPLLHENEVTNDLEQAGRGVGGEQHAPSPAERRNDTPRPIGAEPAVRASPISEARVQDGLPDPTVAQDLDPVQETPREDELLPSSAPAGRHHRRWPLSQDRDMAVRTVDGNHPERDHRQGWEP
jgi:conjugative relaxase-like TrwC/TraI family protein